MLGSLARLLGAHWVALASGEGRIEAHHGGRVFRRLPPGSPRDLDPGLLAGLEPGRAVSFGPEVLRRRPRSAGSALREVLVYTALEEPSTRLVAGLRAPSPIATRHFEELARFALGVRAAGERRLSVPVRAVELACATHDLRHLLTVAILELERARDGTPTSGQGEALARVQRTLEEARASCEPHRGTLELRRLLPILGSAARDAEVAARRAGRVAVVVRCDPDLAASVDGTVLERAIRNLVLNAIEATPDGGCVEIAADPDPAGEVAISVRDEGRGIAREDLRELLRAGRSGSGGSGFGTASVRASVRELSGRLSVRSRPRAGTEFVIRLPPA